jgi:PAS domain S-box-containing protein
MFWWIDLQACGGLNNVRNGKLSFSCRLNTAGQQSGARSTVNSGQSKFRKDHLLYFPCAVLLAGLGLTIFATYYAARSIELRTEAEFDRNTQHFRAAIRTRMEAYIALLRGGAGMFAVKPDLTKAEFHSYVQRLRLSTNYPGVLGVGYAARVRPGDKERFIRWMQLQGQTNFSVYPDQEHDDSFSVAYLEPQIDRNKRALGYNMFSDPVRREAMERARDSGRRAASGKIRLIQEIDPPLQSGFLLYVSVYQGGQVPPTIEERRSKLAGFIYSPFRVGDLISTLLVEETSERPQVEIYDGPALISENELFRSTMPRPPGIRWLHPYHESVFPLDIAGRIWTVRYGEYPPLEGSWWTVPTLFLVGILLSLGIFYVTLEEARARQNAERAATRLKESETALRQSETQFRLMLENARDYAIFSTDLAGHVTRWSAGAERLFGFSEAEVLGRSSAIIFVPEDRERHVPEEELKRALESGVSRNDRWHQKKDGTRLFISGVVRPMHDATGTPLGFINIARDVTQRVQIEENLRHEMEFSESIIKSLPGIFFLFDQSKQSFRWNETMEKVTGYSQDEIASRKLTDFFSESDKPRIAAAIQQALQTGESSVEAMLITRDGNAVPYLFSGRRLSVGDGPCIMGIGMDVSQRQQVEQDLRDAQDRLKSYTSELEQRVAQRTAHLQQSLQSLEGLLYHVAHDLRAPLRSMASFTNILLEEYGSSFDERGKDYAHRISASARRMDELVHDLLAYGRLAHAQVPLHEVNLEAELDAVLDQFPDIKEHRAEVIVQKPLPPVIGNASVLEQVLSNIISNALKFVPSGVSPRIRIWSENGNGVRLWIQDNGIGIRPEYHDRIFRVFERLHTTADYPGTGIGLAIVKKAMERMGGRVGVDSTSGEGSRFWLELAKVSKSGEP